MFNDKLSFYQIMLRELRLLKKRLKLFEYFRNLSTPAGFVFLQETHSSVDVEK